MIMEINLHPSKQTQIKWDKISVIINKYHSRICLKIINIYQDKTQYRETEFNKILTKILRMFR